MSARVPHSGRSLRMLVVASLAVVTAATVVAISTRFRLEPNVASLLPEQGEAAALRRYLRGFGGSDLALVLVRDTSERSGEVVATEVAAAARAVADDLRRLDTVRFASTGSDLSGGLDPMLLWRHADAGARERLAAALKPAAMRARLRGSRAMLLAPAGGEAREIIARDPLRLGQVLVSGANVAGGFRAQPDGTFASDDGRASLVLVFPEGQALRGVDARAFVRDARGVLARQAQAHPRLSFGLTGGHAIAEATERMLVRDLTVSGSASMLLAALAFALTFRRLRALLAVMPPLVLGTLWTAGIAAALPGGLSAIAVAFMSVVVGVGVDTGVHVYAALLAARRRGLEPAAAALAARRETGRPVMVAALTAGAAFGSLGLSEIGALRQLGILCAAGEVLTAIAIVIVTPAIGERLERRPPPPEQPPRWTDLVDRLTSSPVRAAALVIVTLAPLVALVAGYRPALADAIVALRPAGLEPLDVQRQVYEAFGGRSGQWVVLVADRERERAHERADRITERLGSMPGDVDAIDSLSTLVPSAPTQRARLRARDALDLPARARELEQALGAEQFAPERFERVLEGMRHPPNEVLALDALAEGDGAIMLSRYLGQDGGDALLVLYVLPHPGHEDRVEAAIREVDAAASITGYGRLESSLKDALQRDLPRIGLVAGALVLLALMLALRRARDVALAAAVVVTELGVVLFAIERLDVPLHAYDALVLPVLLGITVDEAMFLLHRARAVRGVEVVRETLRREGPLVATTALTTAAGFGALLLCDFDGLRHLGMVGAIGSIAGLLIALVLLPAGLRLTGGRVR